MIVCTNGWLPKSVFVLSSSQVFFKYIKTKGFVIALKLKVSFPHLKTSFLCLSLHLLYIYF